MFNSKLYFRLPTIGIVLFIGIYIYASPLYPGGSQADSNSPGFDWFHNYWCNLLNLESINGEQNQARPYAISAMVLLCVAMSLFFIQFAQQLAQTKLWKNMIQFGGILSMFFAVFMFSSYHDLMTIVASFFGLFAVLGIIRSLYISDHTIMKVTGLICLILLAFNNYIYYSEHLLYYLPLIQKITFAVVLGWIVVLQENVVMKTRA